MIYELQKDALRRRYASMDAEERPRTEPARPNRHRRPEHGTLDHVRDQEGPHPQAHLQGEARGRRACGTSTARSASRPTTSRAPRVPPGSSWATPTSWSASRCVIGTPFADTPDKGVLSTNAELIPMGSPNFEAGPPDEHSIELARVVDRGIRESEMIDLEKMCIENRARRSGSTSWTSMCWITTATCSTRPSSARSPR